MPRSLSPFILILLACMPRFHSLLPLKFLAPTCAWSSPAQETDRRWRFLDSLITPSFQHRAVGQDDVTSLWRIPPRTVWGPSLATRSKGENKDYLVFPNSLFSDYN